MVLDQPLEDEVNDVDREGNGRRARKGSKGVKILDNVKRALTEIFDENDVKM